MVDNSEWWNIRKLDNVPSKHRYNKFVNSDIMTNQKIVLASIVVVVATGLIAIDPSTWIGNTQGQLYDNNYYQEDNRYSYDKKDSKAYTDVQK